MWRDIKRGFGWSFGGRIGWELGGVAWRLMRRLALAMAVVVYASAQSCNQTAPAPEKPKAVQKKGQNNDNGKRNQTSAH